MAAPFRLDRTLIRVSGPDARRFLNDVLTQNVEKPSESGLRYAALLSAQGKVIADMFAWDDGDGVILDTDPARSADILRRLSIYKLRAQATLTEDADLAVVWSREALDGAPPDPRLATMGARKLAPASEANTLALDTAAYNAHRIALGIPDLARDAQPDEVFAGEALLEELNGVDFQKGCFVGQENASRMKRRATTRKKFCPIIFEGTPPTFGAKVMANSADLGTVRTGLSGRALALLRLDRADEALAAGQAFHVDGRPVKLDPPPWLIMPPVADAPG